MSDGQESRSRSDLQPTAYTLQPASAPVWEDYRWTPLPHLMGTMRADVCVVGLGGSGLSAIHALVARNRTVIGIDAGRVAGGAAGANGGFLLAGAARFYHTVTASLGRERALRLYRLTMAEIERMQEEMPDIVRRVGSLRIAMSQEELVDCDAQFAAMQADDLPIKKYTGPEGQGLLIPTDAVFNPLTRCRRLAQSALQKGVRLFEDSPAVEINGAFVRTEQGLIRCKSVVVAVDGKLELVLPELIGRVRTARLQMIATAPVAHVKIDRAVYARNGYEYWQQLPDGSVALGGFRDIGGDAEWTHSTEITDLIQTRLESFLREHLKIESPITHRWAASVGYTRNSLPIAEQIRPNVWAIGGYNGTGNVIGALCGREVAARLSGEEDSLTSLLSDSTSR
jgi:gamma-glutamylputrescine oxidase